MVLYVSAVDELHIGLGHWQQPEHCPEGCELWRDAFIIQLSSACLLGYRALSYKLPLPRCQYQRASTKV